MICDLDELQHVHGRALTHAEEVAIEDAIIAAKTRRTDRAEDARTASEILEEAFGRPNGLDPAHPHLCRWAHRYVALQVSGRDPAKNPARRFVGFKSASRRKCQGKCGRYLSVKAFRLEQYGHSAECTTCKP